MSDMVINFGLIGLGNMGQNHLRILSILKTVNLQFIYDADLAKANQLAASHGTRAAVSINDALENYNIDAVVICSPTSTHYEYIQAFSNKVRNIFVEKPMAVSLDQAQKIKSLIDNKSINLQVGFIERYNPAVQQLKKVLDSSRRVINVDFTRTNKLSARITDVDVISDLMIHDIDLALYLNGAVTNVEAQGMRDDETGLIRFASANLTHGNGKFSRIQASCITEKKMRKIEATCDGVFIDCELVRKEILVNRQSEIHQKEGEAYRISSVQENIEVKPQEALLIELQSFIASCAGTKTNINPSVDDGVNAIRICELIRERISKS